MGRLQQATLAQIKNMEHETISVKNKLEKLQRIVVEKESQILELTNNNAKLTLENKQIT